MSIGCFDDLFGDDGVFDEDLANSLRLVRAIRGGRLVKSSIVNIGGISEITFLNKNFLVLNNYEYSFRNTTEVFSLNEIHERNNHR